MRLGFKIWAMDKYTELLHNHTNSRGSIETAPTSQNQTLPDPQHLLSPVPIWPLVVQLLSGIFCLGCSATYHLVKVKSLRAKTILSKLDYSGIIILILGSSFPPHIYPFVCPSTFRSRNIFLVILCTSCFLCFIAITTPFF